MNQKSTEIPNQKPELEDDLEKEGLYLIEGMRITGDGRILGFDILDNEHNRNVLKDTKPVSMDSMNFDKENHNKVKYTIPLPPGIIKEDDDNDI